MKKYNSSYFHVLLLAVVLVSLNLVSCSGHKTEKSDSDSVVDEVIDPEEVSVSPDLGWKELSGNVEYAVTLTELESERGVVWIDSIRFSPAGNVEYINIASIINGHKMIDQASELRYDEQGDFIDGIDRAGQPMKIVINRDDDSRIVSYSRVASDPNFDDERAYTETFIYNSAGRIERYELQGYEWNQIKTYTYDEGGRIIRIVDKAYDLGAETVSNETIEYVSDDEKGNWTERKVKIVRTIKEDMAEPVKETDKRVERRRIKYYER